MWCTDSGGPTPPVFGLRPIKDFGLTTWVGGEHCLSAVLHFIPLFVLAVPLLWPRSFAGRTHAARSSLLDQIWPQLTRFWRLTRFSIFTQRENSFRLSPLCIQVTCVCPCYTMVTTIASFPISFRNLPRQPWPPSEVGSCGSQATMSPTIAMVPVLRCWRNPAFFSHLDMVLSRILSSNVTQSWLSSSKERGLPFAGKDVSGKG